MNAREVEELARDVAQRFHRLPGCPKALTVQGDGVGNIRIELYGKHFVMNAIIVDRGAMSPEWCLHVLQLVQGVPGRHVAEVIRRATISAALSQRQLLAMAQVACGEFRANTAPLVELAGTLVDRDLIGHRVGGGWELTEFGADALIAHQL